MLELSANPKPNHEVFNKKSVRVLKKSTASSKKVMHVQKKNECVSKNDFLKLKTTKGINCHART